MDEALNPPLNPDLILDKALAFFLSLFLFCIPFMGWRYAQILVPILSTSAIVVGPIALDTTCTGNPSSATTAPCSSAMSLAGSGESITIECSTNGSSFDPSNAYASDPVNGKYDALVGFSHPTNSNDWVAYFVKFNSASGSITPQCNGWEPNGWVVAAQAWKNTRTIQGLDGGSVNQSTIHTTPTANPTSGTAASPTTNAELVACDLVRSSASATSNSGAWLPAGTLTPVTNTLAQYFQYQIQTTAASVNCPFTGSTTNWTDGQFAILPAAAGAGYTAVTGVYGAPAAAQTNGATVTPAILNSVSGSLTPLNVNPGWALGSGSNVTFDTSVAPTGSLKLLVNGVAHTLGDSLTSIKFPAANTTTQYGWFPKGIIDDGSGRWLFSFQRMGANATNNTFCDDENLDGTISDGNVTLQFYYDTTNGIHFQIERSAGNTPTIINLIPSPILNLTQDYGYLFHEPGVNEANEDIYVFGEATPGTLPWTLLDHFSVPKGGQLQGTATASAGSGATSITVTSPTATIVVGQSVFSATTSVDAGQITHGTLVTSVSGTGPFTVGISLPTNAPMSATPIEFAGPTANASVSITGNTLTVTGGQTGTIATGGYGTGAFVGMTGVPTGTWVVSGSGPYTLSQPVPSSVSGMANFWPPGPGGNDDFHIGKFSSCTSTADMWFNSILWDPYGTIGPLIANGTLPL